MYLRQLGSCGFLFRRKNIPRQRVKTTFRDKPCLRLKCVMRKVPGSEYTGLFEMTVGVLTTCHTQYTSDSSICIFYLIEQHSQVFVTYLTGALYVHPL